MKQVAEAIERVTAGTLPVIRELGSDEAFEIMRLSSKTEGPEKPEVDVFKAICNAYKFGYWMGWNHCEIEFIETELQD